MTHNEYLFFLGQALDTFCNQHAEWSRSTFGEDSERGPIGPLKHLEKEAREAYNHPDNLEEYADCLLLLVDANRRAGWTPLDLICAAQQKLEKCKQRQWVRPTNPDEPIEHDRTGES